MPLYVADYLADTRRLTTLEHGAYILLIMEYWRNGGLPKDDATLARIVGLTLEEWQCVRITIAMLFSPDWTHKRIEYELARSKEKSAKAKAAANNRWKDKKNLNNANALRSQSEGNAVAMLSQPQSHKEVRGYPIQEYREVSTERPDANALRPHFDEEVEF
jgi:uncharacterized protein YdaU (DUF1376 family)